ncbi:MAG: long-chain-fatty-acid--CoA ligase [Gammaproteobacteria bacterium]|nr:long-chain-fatty-acid--CoA ligase [Gammaproteobacteria bacterium]
MQGLIMDVPLTITSIMQHADCNHGDQEIVSITTDNPRHRYTYAEAFRRTRKLANALSEYGIKPSDRIGTLAWNDYRHFELYFGVAGIGAITHTINPRLFPEQIIYIINHAEDRLIFVDPFILPTLEAIADQLIPVEAFIVLTDDENLPSSTLKNIMSYEHFIGTCKDEYSWPDLDERSASSLCYTSGTTGNPKGVLYSHRANVLHSYASNTPDVFNFSTGDAAMPVVPMFHVNAWGIPYASPMVGVKLVFPGPKMGDGASLQALIEEEKVTFSAGVPTVWLALLNYLNESGKSVDSLKRVIIGGAACPEMVMRQFLDNYGVHVHHAWGMTETSPLGTVNTLKAHMEDLPDTELYRMKLKQGRALYGIEMKIVDDDNIELARDGKSSGLLKVRGPWVCSDYFKMEGKNDVHDQDGWFATGDVATIDSDGYMQITDRSKDVIKSGGEWISSMDLENAAVGHPDVVEAAVIGISHPKWSERPLLVIVRNPNSDLQAEEIIDWLKDKVAKWWLPDAVEFVDEIPHTATGKILKLELRKQFSDFTFDI